METKKTNLKLIIGVIVLVVIAAIMGIVYANTKPKGEKGSKEITVEVIIPGKETKTLNIKTGQEYLGQALEDKNLISGTKDTYGLLIKEVNGHVADAIKKEFWAITINGEWSDYGVDQIPVKDGNKYEFTLSTY